MDVVGSKRFFARGSFRDGFKVEVEKDCVTKPLKLRTQAGASYPKSPTGHSWGYGGSGPAQLAIDLLWEVYGVEPSAPLFQGFKWAVIAQLPQEAGWALTESEIKAKVDQIVAGRTFPLFVGVGE